jgi:hypothetical protein
MFHFRWTETDKFSYVVLVDWPSGTAPTQQAWGPEFKPQYRLPPPKNLGMWIMGFFSFFFFEPRVYFQLNGGQWHFLRLFPTVKHSKNNITKQLFFGGSGGTRDWTQVLYKLTYIPSF